eukprot:119667-Chlamydomonas_euryale.AAC.2
MQGRRQSAQRRQRRQQRGDRLGVLGHGSVDVHRGRARQKARAFRRARVRAGVRVRRRCVHIDRGREPRPRLRQWRLWQRRDAVKRRACCLRLQWERQASKCGRHDRWYSVALSMRQRRDIRVGCFHARIGFNGRRLRLGSVQSVLKACLKRVESVLKACLKRVQSGSKAGSKCVKVCSKRVQSEVNTRTGLQLPSSSSLVGAFETLGREVMHPGVVGTEALFLLAGLIGTGALLRAL